VQISPKLHFPESFLLLEESNSQTSSLEAKWNLNLKKWTYQFPISSLLSIPVSTLVFRHFLYNRAQALHANFPNSQMMRKADEIFSGVRTEINSDFFLDDSCQKRLRMWNSSHIFCQLISKSNDGTFVQGALDDGAGNEWALVPFGKKVPWGLKYACLVWSTSSVWPFNDFGVAFRSHPRIIIMLWNGGMCGMEWWYEWLDSSKPYTPLHPNSQLRGETLKRRKGRKEVA